MTPYYSAARSGWLKLVDFFTFSSAVPRSRSSLALRTQGREMKRTPRQCPWTLYLQPPTPVIPGLLRTRCPVECGSICRYVPRARGVWYWRRRYAADGKPVGIWLSQRSPRPLARPPAVAPLSPCSSSCSSGFLPPLPQREAQTPHTGSLGERARAQALQQGQAVELEDGPRAVELDGFGKVPAVEMRERTSPRVGRTEGWSGPDVALFF